MKFLVSYRKGDIGEIEAEIEANSPDEASRKFLAGDCKYKVNPEALWADQVKVDEM